MSYKENKGKKNREGRAFTQFYLHIKYFLFN